MSRCHSQTPPMSNLSQPGMASDILGLFALRIALPLSNGPVAATLGSSPKCSECSAADERSYPLLDAEVLGVGGDFKQRFRGCFE